MKTENTPKKPAKKPRSRFFRTFWSLIFLLFVVTLVLVWLVYSMLTQSEKEVYQSPADQPAEIAPVAIINPTEDTKLPPPANTSSEADIEKLEPIESATMEEPNDIENIGKPLDPTNQGNFDNLF